MVTVPKTLKTDYGEHEADMAEYRAHGVARALDLSNRGPIQYRKDGSLNDDILESYWRYGFYIFEGLIKPEELAEMEQDVLQIVDRAPVEPGSTFDKFGMRALGLSEEGNNITLVRPLSDPLGGTSKNNGRHPSKMFEPKVPPGAPKWIPQLIWGPLQYSDAALRLYVHPDILRAAAAVNRSSAAAVHPSSGSPDSGASAGWRAAGCPARRAAGTGCRSASSDRWAGRSHRCSACS